jgi:hypothetical protein
MPSPILKKVETASKKITDLIPSAKGGILTNKWILYVVLFAALFDLFQFYQRGDVYSVTIFFIIGVLVSFFSKNMVVILILAIVVTHLIKYGKQLTEGFKDEEEEEFADKEDEEEFADKEDETKETTEPTETTEPKDTFRNKDMGAISTTDAAVKDAFSTLEPGDLTAKTQQLLSMQKDLMKNMDKIEPLLKDADTFLSRRKEKFTSLSEAYSPKPK